MRIDANVILRFLTGDPPDQAAKVSRLFTRAEAREFPLEVEDVVLAEVVWTLSSYYKAPKVDIADGLLELLAKDWITNSQKEVVQLALALFAQRNVDFADALLAARALSSRAPEICSFDRDFDRIPGVIRIEPE